MDVNFKNKIDFIDASEKLLFESVYLKKQKPVVISNIFKTQEISNWSFEFFRNCLGEYKIGLFNSNEKYLDRSFKHPPIKMKFAEYLDILQKGPYFIKSVSV